MGSQQVAERPRSPQATIRVFPCCRSNVGDGLLRPRQPGAKALASDSTARSGPDRTTHRLVSDSVLRSGASMLATNFFLWPSLEESRSGLEMSTLERGLLDCSHSLLSLSAFFCIFFCRGSASSIFPPPQLLGEQGLVVQLFADKPISDFRSIQDVKNCRIDARDMCLPSNGATEVYWRRVIEKSRGECRKMSLEEDQPKFIEAAGRFKHTYAAGLDAVAEGDCKYFMASASTIAAGATNEYCGVLSVVGEPFFPNAVGFALPKGSSMAGPISTATLEFHQEDSLPTLIEYGVSQECNISMSATRLDWSRMSIVVYVKLALHALMLLYVIIDRRPKRSPSA